jgi:imidazolonepropionase-like amidohydrolase
VYDDKFAEGGKNSPNLRRIWLRPKIISVFSLILPKISGFMRFIALYLAMIVTVLLPAQNPSPSAPQQGAVLILGGTAHLGNGKVIQNSAIAFDFGKLTLVADATTIRLDRSGYKQIFDASGKHIYPGLIALNTSLGLVELDAVRSTRDANEIGDLNPSVRALVAYNTDSDLIPTVRSNGVLIAQIVPKGGRISGTSSVVQLDAWNWEDAAVLTDEGLHMNWPEQVFGKPESEDALGTKYQTSITELRKFFTEAKVYSQVANHEQKLIKFEALRPVFAGKTKVYIHAEAASELLDALHFAQEFGLKIVLVGASESYLIAETIAAAQVPVVLGSTQSLPDSDEADYDLPYKTPAILQKAGVLFAITDVGGWRQRNLPFQAGQAVGFGLDKESAIAAISANPAKIMGLENQLGTLETEKDATLIITEGDVLEMRTSNVIAAWIAGRPMNLDDKQKQLYRKWREKY